MPLSSPFHLTVAQAVEQLPAQTEQQLRFVTLLQRGSLSVELYAPEHIDRQEPHQQDELYVVISGQGDFINGNQQHRFQPGDVLFVPAGVPHHFENFSADFKTWVIFFGPQGGEC
jgi:mannose-6-phosphate isomerase-like protein (cupin superfamily)